MDWKALAITIPITIGIVAILMLLVRGILDILGS